MKYKKKILANIAPENRLTIEQKLETKGYKFQKIQLVEFRGQMGIYCPDADNIFVYKNICKSCPRWLGGSGKYYYCLVKNKEI